MKTFATAFLITVALACLTWLAYQGFPLLLVSEPEAISEAEQMDDEPNPALPVFDPCAPRMHRN